MNRLASVAALAAAALTSAGLPAPAQAADRAATPATVQVIISSHGLDLDTEAGAQAFLQRLAMAAGRACDLRAEGPTITLTRSPAFRACQAKAIDAAMAQVRSPIVKREYAEWAPDALRLARR